MSPLSGAFALPLYLALAGSMLWVCHLWVRPLSKWTGWVLLCLPWVITGPAMVHQEVFGPVDLAYMGQPLYSVRSAQGIDGDFSPLGGDVTFQLIPWRKAVRYEIQHGRWPLWNRFMLSGDILAGSAIPAPYHPVNLLSFLLPFGASLAFVAAATLFSAGLFAFLFLRELHCRESAAWIGAASWMFSGFMTFWLQWPHTLTVAAFPLVLLAVRRIVRRPSSRSTLLLAVSFAWVLLAGHPESAFHVVAVGALYGIAELSFCRERRLFKSIGLVTVASVMALALSAVYLMPFVEAMPQSHEYELRRQLYAGSDRSVSGSEALRRGQVNALPWVYGLPWEEDAGHQDPFFVPLSSAYIGSCLFPFLVLGVGRFAWRGRWCLIAFALGGLSLGASAPGLSDLLAHLPLFDLSINKRLVFVAGFALSALAAMGVEVWCRRTPRRNAGPALWTVLFLGGLIAVQWRTLSEAGLSTDFLLVRSVQSLLPPLLVAILMFIRGMSRRSLLILLLFLLVAQRGVEVRGLHPTFTADAFFPTIRPLEKLRQEPGVFRVVGTGTALIPNISTLYELEDVRGYQGMYFDRSKWTYPLWTETEPSHHYYRVDDLSRPFLSFLNIRFAIVPEGDPAPTGWNLWARNLGIQIFENPRVVERVSLPAKVRVDVPPAKMRQEMMSHDDFAGLAWIETGSPEAGGDAVWETRANGPGEVRFERRPYGYGIDADLEGAGWIVVSETAWKGWRAFCEGEELELAYANRAFLAFHLPPGTHHVELIYQPPSFVWGRAISLGTLGLWIAWVLHIVIRSRRPGPAPSSDSSTTTFHGT